MAQDSDSLSRWLPGLKAGDEQAVAAIWRQCGTRLVRLATKQLTAKGVPGREGDGDDVAQSVYARFCLKAREGRFPKLDDRHDLWRLLFRLTFHKVLDRRRRHVRRGRVVGESKLGPRSDSKDDAAKGLAAVVANTPTPELAAIMAEQVERLLSQLDERAQFVAVARLDGYTTAEIAQKLNRSVRTVELATHLIRKKWERELAGGP